MSAPKSGNHLFLASAVAAALGAMQGRWLRKARIRNIDDDVPAGKRIRISVAEGKRRAIKARNVRRHRLAMKRRGRR